MAGENNDKGKTREQLRAELGGRRAEIAVTPRDLSLEAEAARIKRETDGGGGEDGPTPGQEAEREHADTFRGKAGQDAPAPTKPGLLERFRKPPQTGGQEAGQMPAVLHSEAAALFVQSAYVDFRKKGHESGDALAMTQAYMIAELAGAVGRAANALDAVVKKL